MKDEECSIEVLKYDRNKKMIKLLQIGKQFRYIFDIILLDIHR